MRWLPTVLYACSCCKEKETSACSWHDIVYLYYCTHCAASNDAETTPIRCQERSLTSAVSRYCPSCLFDAPSQAALRPPALGRCTRISCLQCPWCSASLQWTQRALEGNGSVLEWRCSFCDYASWENAKLGILLEEPLDASQKQPAPSMSLLTEAMERVNGKQEQEAFDRLSKRLNLVLTGNALQETTSTTPKAGRRRIRFKSSSASQSVPPFIVDLTDLIKESNATNTHSAISSLEQRLNQPASQSIYKKDLLPQRVPLNARLQYRCLKCESLLYKPGTAVKPQTLPKPAIHHAAWFYLPRVTLLQVQETGREVTLVLRVVNPLDKEMTVTLTDNESSPWQQQQEIHESKSVILEAFDEVHSYSDPFVQVKPTLNWLVERHQAVKEFKLYWKHDYEVDQVYWLVKLEWFVEGKRQFTDIALRCV